MVFVLCFAAFLPAQIRNGNIFGKVVDAEGNALPGVSVTLIPSAGAPATQLTTAEGGFRFLSLGPAKDYKIKCEITGFKSRTESGIVVVVGGNTNIEVKMEIGVLEEQVTVVARSPVVDNKKTNVGQSITQDILQMLPTARDPWVVLQMVPSVTVDRENLGGTDSGQQAYFVGKGGTSDQNQWSVDGVLVTDPAAIGASPTYFDFDAFEEMNVTTGGGDVTSQTSGVALNMVTRRGGNKVSLGGRFYFTDPQFQAAWTPAQLKNLGIPGSQTYNVIRGIKDYGFNVGGPLWKDKAWLWGSYGVQDIKVNNINGVADDTLLSNYVAKLDLQLISGNKFEIFMHSGNKEKFGRDSDYYGNPLGNHQTARFHFGTPIWKAEDEQMFGDNLLVSAKFGYSHAGFLFLPMQDQTLTNWTANNIATGVTTQYDWYYDTNRPLLQWGLYANYFNDKLFGVSHEMKFGVEYVRRFTTTDSSSAGNTSYNYNYNYPTYDPNATGDPSKMIVDPDIKYISTWRGYYIDSKIASWAGYFTDTVTIGRMNLLLGLRYDYQKPYLNPFTMTHADNVLHGQEVWTNYFTAAAHTAISSLMPGLSVPGYSSDYVWSSLQPRLGITYDVTGDGKTILKASFAKYGEFMGIGEAGNFYPSGTGGWMDFWWKDANKDGKADINELYWLNPNTNGLESVFNGSGNLQLPYSLYQGIMWGGYDPTNPQKVGPVLYTIDPKTNNVNTWEGIITLEREVLTDFQVALDLTYKRFDNFRWTRVYYPDTDYIRSTADYMQVSYTVPDLNSKGVNMGTGTGKPFWVLGTTPGATYSDYRYVAPNPGFHETYYSLDLRFNKRLSNRWMFNGSFTYNMQKQHYDASGYLDPTQIWAVNDREYSQYMGSGSGKISQYTFSPWMVKLEGLYQLPLGFDISGTFTARDGHIITHTMVINDRSLPNPLQRSTTVYLDYFGTERLPTFWNMNFRLEKMVKIGDGGRIYFMADVFNLFNQALMNRRYMRSEGTYYVATDLFVPTPSKFQANEVLNPRTTRFGVRFTF